MGTGSVCQFHQSSPTVLLRAFSFLMLAWGTLVSLWSEQIVASLLRTRKYAWMCIFISACKSITNIISCALTFYFPERPRCQLLVNFAGTVDYKSPLRHCFSVSRRCRILLCRLGIPWLAKGRAFDFDPQVRGDP